MINVLVFGMTAVKGGMESCVMNYYRNVDPKEVHFDFLCNDEPMVYADEVRANHSKIFYIPKRSKNPFQYYRTIHSFFTEHAKEYDSLWFNTCSLSNITYLKYAKKYGIPQRIVHAHNSQNMDSKIRGFLHKVNRKTIHKYATDFWTCGVGATEYFYAYDSEVKNVVTINNAIDINAFQFNQEVRNTVRNELNVCTDTFVVGNVGRLHYQKNQEFLLDIFHEIHTKKKDSILLLVGTGPDYDALVQKVNRLQLKESVLFLGQRDDVSSLMQGMDAFVLPSRFEGLGMVLIEAQASGLPCFTSKDVVPESAKVSELLTYVSLESTPEQWAKIILDYSQKENTNRFVYSHSIESSDYNIQNEATKFLQYLRK